jgi:glutamate synthase (NADPH/NADH) large chain
MLSGEVAKRYGHAGLPEDTIAMKLTGTAGQSFGAFLARGVSFDLEGDATTMSARACRAAASSSVRREARQLSSPRTRSSSATPCSTARSTGECYFRGVAGERFAVRNSGAIAVVEGTGDHGCEYMTGGVVVVLGKTGRNFAAGMSGGVAYVASPAAHRQPACQVYPGQLGRRAWQIRQGHADRLSPGR